MAFSKDMISIYSDQLSAYKSACEEHSDLGAFDSSIQQRTCKVVDSLIVGDDTDPLSLHKLHMEVSEHLHTTSVDVAKFITENENGWEDEDLRSLVIAYFNNTIETLGIFNTVMECVEKAEMGELLILEAVALFDKASSEKDGGTKKNYEKVLKKLKKFKAMGDPFGGQVLKTQFELLSKQQQSLFDEVCKHTKKIQEKGNKLEETIKLSNVVFGATLSASAAATMAYMSVLEKVGESFAAILSPLTAVGWFGVRTLLEEKKTYEEARAKNKKMLEDANKLKQDISTGESVAKGLENNKVATEDVSALVTQLENKIKAMLDIVDNAMENEEDNVDQKITLTRIKEKVSELATTIKQVGKHVAERSEIIYEARKRVMEKINEKGHVV